MVQRRIDLKGPWEVYNPGYDYGVIFIQFEGNDWYKYREFITKKYIVVFTAEGVIIDIYDDHSRAFPGGLMSAEIDEIPEGVTKETHRFGPEGFYEYVASDSEIIAKNTRIQKKGYKRISEKVNSLVMLKNIGVISPEEQKELDSLTEFAKALHQVDLLNPTWPKLPN